ncbi:winged helix-turn-helix domain-containing protein [Actinosynnema sp. NPDC047251]|uniref:Transcriptional regulator, ArsR family n=1 Tax=Saccharothrix espanaensis (strain ATCC 51144 / DSM 44229 / JCM 9112 / NBRC 15066 / NRRL 15764) TaxID=1179773 RepID=K0K342_SACES|nr:winged helix-turn-helix domain-containing protein [Saccharothrix espanaensis]CCH31304.1 Transcriptional regulator, ArsR family [Saccharothrix espanaensis DSM 44229]
MLRVIFTTDDLVRTTVAPTADPLWEVVLGGCRLRDRDRPAAFHEWSLEMRRRLDSRSPAVRVLHLLSPAPDLLTPPEAAAGLEAGLAALRATPAHRVRAELSRFRPLPEWTKPLAGGDRRALAVLADMVRHLHSRLVAPYSDVIRESVNADRARRARDLVDGGVHALLAGLGPYARWEPPVLEVDHPEERELPLRGRGLRLVPSYFGRQRPCTLADPAAPPVLVYPLEDGDRWRGAEPRSLDALLGPTRSAVLECARAGAGTTELARRVGTSPASVSRHTGVLRAAGLLRTSRHGTQTVHSLTVLGESLLAGHQR